ncbi:MAG: hypothetical protein JJU36_05550 [Phycisphaeraceae bacterium]|nr:hypothetical protein [Phycisphaeraceae bacterium]
MHNGFIRRCHAVLLTYIPRWRVSAAIIFWLVIAADVISKYDGEVQDAQWLVWGLNLLCMWPLLVVSLLKAQLASERVRLLPGHFWPHIVVVGLILVLMQSYLLFLGGMMSLWLPGVLAFGLFFSACYGIAAWMYGAGYWSVGVVLITFMSTIVPVTREWHFHILLLGEHPDGASMAVTWGLAGIAIIVWRARILSAESPEIDVHPMFKDQPASSSISPSKPSMDDDGFFMWLRDRALTRLLNRSPSARWWRMSMHGAAHEPVVVAWVRTLAFALIAAIGGLLAPVLLTDLTQATIVSFMLLILGPMLFAYSRLLGTWDFMELEMLRPVERWAYGRDRFLYVCLHTCGIWLLLAVCILPVWWWNAQLGEEIWVYVALALMMPAAMILGLLLDAWFMLLSRSRASRTLFSALGMVVPQLLVFIMVMIGAERPGWDRPPLFDLAGALAGFLITCLALAGLVAGLAGRRWMRIDLV